MSTVCAMLYLQVSPSQPHIFIQELCKAVAEQRSVPSQLLLLLPQAAALCGTPLPQDFMPQYEAMLGARAVQQRQSPSSQRKPRPQGAHTTASLLQGVLQVSDPGSTVRDWAVAPQMVELVLQPLLQLHQPVMSPLLIGAATSHWLDSCASLRLAESAQEMLIGASLVSQASTILHTVCASEAAPYAILQSSLDSMVTHALQLAVAGNADSDTSAPQRQCSSEAAELVHAVGCYVRHLSCAPALPVSSQPFELGLLLESAGGPGTRRSKSDSTSADGDKRQEWVRCAVTLLKTVGSDFSALAAQGQQGLSTAELIRMSHSITVELGGPLGETGLGQEVKRLLAGQISAGVVFHGMEKSR